MSRSKFASLIIAQFLLLGCVPEEPGVKPSATSKLDLYSYENVIIQHSKRGLSPGSEIEFKKFKASNGYYGAFAVNFAEDIATWASNHSLQEAKKQTLGVCKLKSRNKNGCIVYASITPKGYSPKNGTLTLSRTATIELNSEIANRIYSKNHGALAINNISGGGWATRDSKDLAMGAAIEECDKVGKGTMEKTSRTWKKYLKPHHFKCKIVYSD